MKKKEITLLSWLLRGSQKREVFKVLDGYKIPAQIYKEAAKHNPKITRNSVSDVLREFKKKGIVICINEKEKKGRIYQLTKKGLLIKDKLRSE